MMEIIKKNTETALFDTLKGLWETTPTSRCLYINFSTIGLDVVQPIESAINALHDYLEDDSRVYLCDDNDVFILTRGLTQKRSDDFLHSVLEHIQPDIDESLPENIHADLFEVGIDWTRLKRLCAFKVEIRAKRDQEKNAKKNEHISSVNREQAIRTINQNLIDTLAKRRAQRDTPEVMVVEDDVFSQKLVMNALKNQYSVSMTADGQGALMTYVSKAPDVLFLDIGLPDIDGHVVLEKLFKIDPDAYVVMFSGNGDKDNILKAISLGAKGFVGKPFAKEKLIQYIEKSPFVQAKANKDTRHGHHTQ